MKLIIPLIILSLISCNSKNRNGDYISIDEYSFAFPNDFKLTERNGIDSYVGNISNDSIRLSFDYGYYSNSLIETEKEFLESNTWRHEPSYQFMEPGKSYTDENMPKVEIIDIQKPNLKELQLNPNTDFVASCQYKDSVFTYPFSIPDKIKSVEIIEDTVFNYYRKIVIAKNPKSGMTGIYMRNLNSYSESINSYLSLSMVTNNLTSEEQIEIVKIFESIRMSEK